MFYPNSRLNHQTFNTVLSTLHNSTKMRRDKTAARIILVLSIAHVAVAAPAVVRQRSLDVAKDVTRTLEKRGNSEDGSSVGLNSVPQMPHDPSPALETPQSQDNLPPTSGTPLSQDDTSPAPGGPESNNDPPAESGDPQSHDHPSPFRWWEHTGWRPTGQIEQGESSSQLELGTPERPSTMPGSPQLQDGSSPPSGSPQLQDDSSSASGSPQLQDGSSSASGSPHLQDGSPPASGIPQEHDDSRTASGIQQVQDDAPPASGTPHHPLVHESFGSGDFDYSGQWVENSHPVLVEGASRLPHPEPEGPAAAAAVAAVTPNLNPSQLSGFWERL